MNDRAIVFKANSAKLYQQYEEERLRREAEYEEEQQRRTRAFFAEEWKHAERAEQVEQMWANFDSAADGLMEALNTQKEQRRAEQAEQAERMRADFNSAADELMEVPGGRA